MGEVADYLAGLDEGERQALEHVYEVARAAVPDTTEGQSYGMAALIYRGKGLFSARAAKRHLSVFPFSSTVVAAVAADLEGFDLSKGTVRFTVDRAVPDEVLTRLVELRRAEIDSQL